MGIASPSRCGKIKSLGSILVSFQLPAQVQVSQPSSITDVLNSTGPHGCVVELKKKAPFLRTVLLSWQSYLAKRTVLVCPQEQGKPNDKPPSIPVRKKIPLYAM